MSRFQANVVKYFNPTGELVRRGQWGRNYTFYPNQVTEVRAEHAEVLEPILKPYGIFPMIDGEDHKSLKIEALKHYARYVDARIKNYQTYLDVNKVVGLNKSKPRKMIQLEKWYEELIHMLGAVEIEEETFSFAEAKKTHTKNTQKVDLGKENDKTIEDLLR